MSDTEMPELPEADNSGSYCALLVAFKTMKERCQQLQARLITVEEENTCLRLECDKDMPTAIVRVKDNDEKTLVQALQEKVEELTEQKSQLTHHIYMVAAENRQLWKRLTKLTRTNKSLGNQLTKISDTLKQHSPAQPADIISYSFRDISNDIAQDANKKSILCSNNDDKELSLEEISCKLINSIMLEKSDLEQQYTQMVELQSTTQLNLQNIGFTYPDDSDSDSLEQLKQHDMRLSQIKDALLAQQTRLKRVLQNTLNVKEEVTCNNCRLNANKKVCQAGTQSDTDNSLIEHRSTQTSPSPSNLSMKKLVESRDSIKEGNKICPICGSFYAKSIAFSVFHEHVLSHFTDKISSDEFESI